MTPRYVIELMTQLVKTDMDSYAWDLTLGSGGFLVSVLNHAIKDAEERIVDPDQLKAKKKHIREMQLLGVELRSQIYMLAVLNMLLVGDGSSNLINADSLLEFDGNYAYPDDTKKFPANTFLLNPPYSTPGNGMVFVEKGFDMMVGGYGTVIIQDSAGSGKATDYNKNILKNNTLIASIKMPIDLFVGKSSVQTSIYVFEVGKPHQEKTMVKFIDFRDDGYTRSNRKRSDKSVNLRDTNNAKERYAELVELVLYGKNYLNYFSENEYIEDRIDIDNGNDWNFEHHQVIDTTPTESDYLRTVGEYLSWEVSQLLKGDTNYD